MPHLPASMIALHESFACLFDPRTRRPGKRTVSAAGPVWGLQEESRFAVYHPVLSRARESSRAVRQVWRGLWLPYLGPGHRAASVWDR